MVAVVTLQPVRALPAASSASAAGSGKRHGDRLRAAPAGPRVLFRSCFHPRVTAGNNHRGTTSASSSSSSAAAAAEEEEEECQDGDIECTWEQLEREVSEETVANVMAKNVAVCHPEESVLTALEVLVEKRLSGTSSGRRGKGIVSFTSLQVFRSTSIKKESFFPNPSAVRERPAGPGRGEERVHEHERSKKGRLRALRC